MREVEDLLPSTAQDKNAWRCNCCACVPICPGPFTRTRRVFRCTGYHPVDLHIVLKEIECFKPREKCVKSEQAVA
jgi:hypothetical protein